jgi:hypothetical protein
VCRGGGRSIRQLRADSVPSQPLSKWFVWPPLVTILRRRILGRVPLLGMRVAATLIGSRARKASAPCAFDMKPINPLPLASAVVLTSTVLAAHAQTSKQVACNGQLIERSKTQAPSQMTAQLTLSAGSVELDLGSGKIPTQIVSNNNIQLQFATKNSRANTFTSAAACF